MKTKTEGSRGWGRAGQIGTVIVVGVAVMLGTTAVSASAQSGENNGLEQRVEALEQQQQTAADKLAITQQLADYGLLFNGDGPHGPDRAKWGEQMFTGDGSFLAFDANLNVDTPKNFTNIKDEIASAIAGQPAVWPNTANPNGSMHYVFNPVFESLTATTAVTDSQSMIVNAVKGTSKVNTIKIAVYHDTWRKTNGVWKKVVSTWYELD